MKKIAALFGALALLTFPASAQDAKGSQEGRQTPGAPNVTPVKSGTVGQPATGASPASKPQTAPGAPPRTVGQAAPSGQAPLESQSIVRTNEAQNAQITVPRPTTKVLGKHVTFGGYFTDFVRAERKRPLFDLKAPIDPKKDMENLSFWPGTDQVQGVVLFSIKF
jgi:hypothetical protein